MILGGGFVAAELGHVFAAFGSEVTICARDDRLVPREDDDIAHAFTARARDWATLELDTAAERVERRGDGIRLHLAGPDGPRVVDGDCLLVAVGRTPNGDVLGSSAPASTTDDGRVLVDDTSRTNVEGIWAFGDLVDRYQLKHCANKEAEIVAHNVCHPDHADGASTGGRSPTPCSATPRSRRSVPPKPNSRPPAARTCRRSGSTPTLRTAGRSRTPPASSSSSGTPSVAG